jgi:hypothetical protein
MTTRSPVLWPDPADEAWQEFCEALERTLGLCMGTHYFAERLLWARGFDAEASLALYEKQGGYCDCEIVFNVFAFEPKPPVTELV